LLPDWTIDQAEELAREVEAELRGPGWTAMLSSRRKAPIAWASQTGTTRRAVVLSAMTTVRMLAPSGAMQRDFKGHPSEAPAGTVPWYDHPNRRTRKQRVLFGHWAALGLLVRDDIAAMDTGCVWGNQLTALRLDDGEIIRQPALEPAAED
jgi:bis(5'-nucleosyl)-tetraphosphatase (symmetrical)